MARYLVAGGWLVNQGLIEFIITFAVGIFFMSSGYHKLFVPEVTAKADKLFTHLGVPVWQRWLVKWGELLGGLGLIFGVLVPYAAAGLLFITFAAICVDCWQDVAKKQPRDAVDWVAKFVYLPETLLILLLLSILSHAD
jgi:uncharacterized membrane protein YphA (DoxX/SURF4 family)